MKHIKFFIQIIGIIILFIIFTLIAFFITQKSNMPNEYIIDFEYMFGVGLPLVIILIYRKIKYNDNLFRNYNKKNNYIGIFTPIIILYYLGPLRIISEYIYIYDDINRDLSWLTIITAIMIAPIMEELIFRGLLQNELEKRYGKIISILISLSLFTIIHQPNQMITALFIGAFLSYSMLKSKNIVNSIILHSVSNIMGVIYDKYIYNIPMYISYIFFILFVIIFYMIIKKIDFYNEFNYHKDIQHGKRGFYL